MNDAVGDSITVVTKKTDKSVWFLTRGIRVRFPSKRSVLTAYAQQRAPVKHKGDSDNRILTHDGHISPTLIPTDHIGSESNETLSHRVFISCELLRGKDIGELPTLFKDILLDVYEDLLLQPDSDYKPPEDFIDTLSTSIAEADAQDEVAITIPSADLLYLLEFGKIYTKSAE